MSPRTHDDSGAAIVLSPNSPDVDSPATSSPWAFRSVSDENENNTSATTDITNHTLAVAATTATTRQRSLPRIGSFHESSRKSPTPTVEMHLHQRGWPSGSDSHRQYGSDVLSTQQRRASYNNSVLSPPPPPQTRRTSLTLSSFAATSTATTQGQNGSSLNQSAATLLDLPLLPISSPTLAEFPDRAMIDSNGTNEGSTTGSSIGLTTSLMNSGISTTSTLPMLPTFTSNSSSTRHEPSTNNEFSATNSLEVSRNEQVNTLGGTPRRSARLAAIQSQQASRKRPSTSNIKKNTPDKKQHVADTKLIDTKPPEASREPCCICMCAVEKDEEVASLSNCSHEFCKTCIMKWSETENSCPLCKKRFKSITILIPCSTKKTPSSKSKTQKQRFKRKVIRVQTRNQRSEAGIMLDSILQSLAASGTTTAGWNFMFGPTNNGNSNNTFLFTNRTSGNTATASMNHGIAVGDENGRTVHPNNFLFARHFAPLPNMLMHNDNNIQSNITNNVETAVRDTSNQNNDPLLLFLQIQNQALQRRQFAQQQRQYPASPSTLASVAAGASADQILMRYLGTNNGSGNSSSNRSSPNVGSSYATASAPINFSSPFPSRSTTIGNLLVERYVERLQRDNNNISSPSFHTNSYATRQNENDATDVYYPGFLNIELQSPTTGNPNVDRGPIPSIAVSNLDQQRFMNTNVPSAIGNTIETAIEIPDDVVIVIDDNNTNNNVGRGRASTARPLARSKRRR